MYINGNVFNIDSSEFEFGYFSHFRIYFDKIYWFSENYIYMQISNDESVEIVYKPTKVLTQLFLFTLFPWDPQTQPQLLPLN